MSTRTMVFKAAICGASLLLSVSVVLGKVTYPPTLKVPVTYYDFHGDGSNPEFEQPMMQGAWVPSDTNPSVSVPGATHHMIKEFLDADGKPQLDSIIPGSRNAYIKYWFRDWNGPGGGKGVKTIPNYVVDSMPNFGQLGWWGGCGLPNVYDCTLWWNAYVRYLGPATVSYDTAFKNVVIHDTLVFTLSDPLNGTYDFDDQTFFPIDGKGLPGAELEPATDLWKLPIPAGSRHNFSFTMEMTMDFVYRPGTTFSFIGDDDLWVFVNGRLALDLGGVHSNAAGSFVVDSIAALTGMVAGGHYPLKLFSAERQSQGSHVKITTNMLVPSKMTLEAVGDSATAGVPTEVLRAIVFDDAGHEITVPGDNIKWNIVTPMPGDQITNPNSTGVTVTFQGTVAWRFVTLEATYTNDKGAKITTTKDVWVSPAAADHIVIEKLKTAATDTGKVQNLNLDMPIGTITVPLGQTGTANAVFRDQFQNFVSLGSSMTWTTADAAKAAIANGTNAWEGSITAPGVRPVPRDTTYITGASGSLKSGTAMVVLEYKRQVKMPIADPDGGTYFGSKTVALSDSTPLAVIYYCIGCDTIYQGSPDTIRYTGPIPISGAGTITIKAFAVRDSSNAYMPSPVMTESYTNGDPYGPAIDTALFFLGGTDRSREDTMLVRFSDTIPCSELSQMPSNVFNYLSQDGTNPLSGARFVAMCDGNNQTDSVLIIFPPGSKVVPGKDSLQIKKDALHDKYGNPSPDPGNKEMIMWGRPYPMVTKTWPNPFEPGVTQIDPGISQKVEAWRSTDPDGQRMVSAPTTGLAVGIKSIMRLDVLKCNAYIYDALGNIVIRDIPVYGSSEDGQFYFFWSGLNANGRMVGAGTYLAIISIKELGAADVNVKKEKIGVRR
jgi:fibro-slime domain-containing protein